MWFSGTPASNCVRKSRPLYARMWSVRTDPPADSPADTPTVVVEQLPFDMDQLMEALLQADAMH